MGRTKGSNPEEKFDNGAKFQISKTSSFSKSFGASRVRDLEPGSNTVYTVTRVSNDGVNEKGKKYYKREVILFDNKEDMKAFNKDIISNIMSS